MDQNKPIKFKLSLIASCVVALSACGGGGGHGGSSDPTVSDLTQGDAFTGQAYTFTTQNISNVTAQYGTITQDPNDSNKWQYVYDVSRFEDRSVTFPIKDTLTITAENGDLSTKEVVIGIRDPLIKYQWHIYNNGDNDYKTLGYSNYPPLKGYDLNIVGAWNLKDQNGDPISGKGVVVGVVDTPVDLEHEDLKNNKYDLSASSSAINSNINMGLSLEFLKEAVEVAHGSAVTGIIAANGKNDLGVRGEAYQAKWYSYAAMDLRSDFLQDNQLLNKTNILSESMGLDNIQIFDPDEYDTLEVAYQQGIPYLQAMGNEYWQDEQNTYQRCTSLDINCQFKQTTTLAMYPNTIEVASINAQGTRSSYSSTGSNVWISGTGGEFGSHTTTSDNAFAIISTLTHYPCSDYWEEDEYSGITIYDNFFDHPNSPWMKLVDPDYTCKYTSTMNGTSAATPSVSGVVALMKQAKPDLTVPQVRYILAKTAQNNSKFTSMNYDPQTVTDLNGNSITVDLGWIDKNDGLKISSWYGFGLANAKDAVQLALNCSDNEYCSTRKNLPDITIKSNDTSCSETSTGEFECTFSDFKVVDEDDAEIGDFDGSLEIENTLLIFEDFKFKESQSPISYGFCNFKSASSLDLNNLSPSEAWDPLTHLQLELSSPNGDQSIVKPYYTTWAPYTKNENYAFSNDFILHTHSFYLDRINSTDSGTWKLTFKSYCDLDEDDLSDMVTLTLIGYKK